MGMIPPQQQGYGMAAPPSMGAPIPGTVPSVPVPGLVPQQQQFGQYMPPQQQHHQQQQQPGQFQPQQLNYMNPPASMGNTQNPTPEPAAAPMPPQPKAPLPEEYVYLQTVFNELRQQCSNAAHNPVGDLW